MAKYPQIRPEEYHDPVYNFIIQGKKRKAKDVLPAYSGGKYDKDDDLIIFDSHNEELDKVIDASCFRCDIKHYNPDVEKLSNLSFQTLMLGLMSKPDK